MEDKEKELRNVVLRISSLKQRLKESGANPNTDSELENLKRTAFTLIMQIEDETGKIVNVPKTLFD